jgi:hypothetical protein|uniref:Uncharacterized protein n=2 Tax=Picea TaxID=3328 RepID=A0A101M0I4_PICGL|nr:hypothetical protein ABT39_MTgene4675 [Picea glauca]QHR89772.1 hypothetical protein Q903MT_gene3794 [Picea sitchensis]
MWSTPLHRGLDLGSELNLQLMDRELALNIDPELNLLELRWFFNWKWNYGLWL